MKARRLKSFRTGGGWPWRVPGMGRMNWILEGAAIPSRNNLILNSRRVNKAVLFILYPALGLLAGWASIAAGWGGKPRAEAEVSHGRREARRSTPPWEAEDFFKAARKKTGERMGGGATAITDLTATWTDAEIRTALEAAMQDPDAMVRFNGLAGLLFREYLRRDLDAALEWMLGQPPLHQKRFGTMLGQAWPESRAMEGLDFLRRHPELSGDTYTPMSMLSKAMGAVSAQGPEAVVALLEKLQAEGWNLNFGFTTNYAPGFDFAGLLGSEDFKKLGVMKNAMIYTWSRSDRDAAFAWVLGNDKPESLGVMARGGYGVPGDTMRWFVGKMEGLTPEQRAEVLDTGIQMYSQGVDAKAWMDAAGTPAVREEIRTAAARGVFVGHRAQVAKAVEAIEGLPEVEARLRLLETMEPPPQIRSYPRPLAPEGENLLRGKLEQWGVEKTRTEAILNRFKQTQP